MPRPVLTSDLVQPVYTGDVRADKAFLIHGEIEGTAFSLGGDAFMTAGHVVRTLNASGKAAGIGLTAPSGNPQRVAVVTDSEELPGDLGIVKVDYLDPESRAWHRALRWSAQPLAALQPVVTFGYPYGVNRAAAAPTIISRAFSGHVVSNLPAFKPLGADLTPFQAHEISFPAPRGLSGSPLLTTSNEVLVSGVVIGNSKSQMLILEAEEVESGTSSITKVQQYESLSLGIATAATAALPMKSRILGMTVQEWLSSIQALATT